MFSFDDWWEKWGSHRESHMRPLCKSVHRNWTEQVWQATKYHEVGKNQLIKQASIWFSISFFLFSKYLDKWKEHFICKTSSQDCSWHYLLQLVISQQPLPCVLKLMIINTKLWWAQDLVFNITFASWVVSTQPPKMILQLADIRLSSSQSLEGKVKKMELKKNTKCVSITIAVQSLSYVLHTQTTISGHKNKPSLSTWILISFKTLIHFCPFLIPFLHRPLTRAAAAAAMACSFYSRARITLRPHDRSHTRHLQSHMETRNIQLNNLFHTLKYPSHKYPINIPLHVCLVWSRQGSCLRYKT